ncbi:LysM peptidoglycan-binding domain-containing protein [Rhodococcus erythropolis]|uniref:LysM peptidoglycan-binding domain-containing protein n=1 Tax=Rhodococcus erythropolis TaxID=1833 RepID=UPI001BE56D39|nr:LysM peptidoglycan-binding domain-containing protein [Rhodococcus erythropolis]MBT2269062.1 LysM peptidoglycan-binding domain-containing protein [Rhodococcus erythropolis]
MSTRTVRSRLAGLGYLLILLLLVAGIPAALWALRGNPLDIPFSDFESLLSSPDDGSLLVALLPLVGWAAWATFTLPILVELAATLRGVKAPKIRLLGSQQKTATFLISGALLLLTAGTATATPALSQPADSASPAPYAPIAAQQDPSGPAHTQMDPRAARPAVQPAGPTVTTVRGDTLWGLAHTHLGDGRLFTELLELNKDVVPEAGFLAEGMTLQLPAVVQDVVQGAYTVEAGDTLWDIADRELGDPLRFSEITTADGSPAGDLITVGQQLIIPSASAQTPVPAADAAPQPAAVPAPAQTPEPAQAQAPDPAPEPLPEIAATPNWQLDPIEPQMPANLTPDAEASVITAAAEDDSSSSSDVVYIALGISALAAAGLTGHLALRRRQQQHRRRRGERIALPAKEAILAEQALTAAVDPLTTAHVDTALRNLAQYCRANEIPIPRLLAVFIGDDTIELGLIEEISLPQPWMQSDDDTWMVDPRAFPRSVPDIDVSPYPALTAMGASDDGRELMLNLEEIGHLSITGTPTATANVLRAMAVELAVSPLADSLHLNVVGYCGDLAGAVNTGRITHSDHTDDVLARLARHLERDADILDENEIESIAHARSVYETSELTAPEVVLISDPLTAEQTEILAAIAENAPRIAFAAVTTQNSNTRSDWTLDVADDGTATLVRPGIATAQLTVTTLDEAGYESIVSLYATTTHDPSPATQPETANVSWEGARLDLDITTENLITSADPAAFTVVRNDDNVIEEINSETVGDLGTDPVGYTETETDASESDVPTAPHIWIHVLGEPTLTPLTPGSTDRENSRSLTEIAVLLAFSDDGVPATELTAKMWPHDVELVNAASTEAEAKTANARLRSRRNQAVTRLRSWMGDTDNGDAALIKSGDRTGRTPLRLHPSVTTDWDYWNQLVDAHPATTTTERLESALALVTGQPFTSDDPIGYRWADHIKQEMISAITDVAEELAGRYIRGEQVTQDLDAAGKAARAGLTVDSAHEGCWRAAIIATHFSGDIETTQTLIDTLKSELDELQVDAHPETNELLRQLDTTTDYRIGAAS